MVQEKGLLLYYDTRRRPVGGLWYSEKACWCIIVQEEGLLVYYSRGIRSVSVLLSTWLVLLPAGRTIHLSVNQWRREDWGPAPFTLHLQISPNIAKCVIIRNLKGPSIYLRGLARGIHISDPIVSAILLSIRANTFKYRKVVKV